MSMIRSLSTTALLGLVLLPTFLQAQAPMPARSASEVQHMLRELRVLGSVLYIAAHPDDENTRMIAYLDRGRGYRTGYLSLTRGDGGQNLIGDEQGDRLGLLRTQELLAARRIDGGEQFFTRAFDFGYSKTPDETLEIWNKEAVLADVVWTIRQFRPDVIITRFATPEKGGGGHGHHTASAMLAHEAFKLAADPNAFPEQLAHVQVWQAKRLVWNNYWVFRDHEPTPDELANILRVEIGGYDPLLGKNYGEIAGEARSMHRCQAFGTSRTRGSIIEYLEHELGEKATGDLFDGIETSWARVGDAALGKLLDRAYENYDARHPEWVLPDLLKAYSLMKNKSGYWYEVKRQDLLTAILYCAGVWTEAGAVQPTVAVGDTAAVTVSLVKRSAIPVEVSRIEFGYPGQTEQVNKPLETQAKVLTITRKFTVPDLPVSQPYWLKQRKSEGIYTVSDQQLIGRPESHPALTARIYLTITGTEVVYETPVIHKYIDRSIGEVYRPFVIVPPVTVNTPQAVRLFPDKSGAEMRFLVKNWSKATSAVQFKLETPPGWEANPAQQSLSLAPGEERTLAIRVTPGAGAQAGYLRAVATAGAWSGSFSYDEVVYDHILRQMVFDPAEVRLVPLDLARKGTLVGYISGSGDEIPAMLEQMGYKVELLEDDKIEPAYLAKFDAVIAGIRVYNTNQRMRFHQEKILEYVKQGGTYLVQYNTNSDMATAQPGPYPLSISRERVTREQAPVTLLKPDHIAFNSPNVITAADFDGWVQERGLYFPGKWDSQYEALTACADPGEPALEGALLVARYGEGYYVHSSFAWFRQLPAGVPGACRLFVNLISLGQ